jgi:phytoene dehydrogenase-like protein
LSNDFDTIIIGSGIGGLTCGAFLAKHGKRVAVCEKHFQIGGYAQNFSRKGFVFDSSVHSVSMADHGFVCGLLSRLNIRDNVTIVPNISTMHIISPHLDYSVPADLAKLTEKLNRDFPGEKESVAALFSDMQVQLSRYKGTQDYGESQARPVSPDVDYAEASLSYGDYIARFIKNKTLQHLFHSIWPFGGTPPSDAPVFHAFIFMVHALEGSHHVKGGFSKLADALAGVITKNGGEVKTKWPVCTMRVDPDKTVCAVVNPAGQELTAESFVSNISPYILHHSIIPERFRSKLWLSRLAKLKPSVSAVCVYLGIQGDVSDIVPDNITFWFNSQDHDAIYKRIVGGAPDIIDHLLIMRPSEAKEKSTLTLIFFVRSDAYGDWGEAKKEIANRMLEKALSLLGNFNDRIRVIETASPATFERYTGNTGGALYGFENVRDLYGQSKTPLTTHLRNLYQSGHWTISGAGIYNVMASGAAVAAKILNR